MVEAHWLLESGRLMSGTVTEDEWWRGKLIVTWGSACRLSRSGISNFPHNDYSIMILVLSLFAEYCDFPKLSLGWAWAGHLTFKPSRGSQVTHALPVGDFPQPLESQRSPRLLLCVVRPAARWRLVNSDGL